MFKFSHWSCTQRWGALLVGLLLARVLLMILFPVFDPSEGRYASICANMAQSGDYLVPRFIHDGVYQSFDGKPPLLFQLGGLFCSLMGRHAFAVRLPSLLAALGILGLLFFVVRKRASVAQATFAVCVCASSVAFYATAGFCMTDLLLTCCISGALLLEYLFYDEQKKIYSLGVFALLGLGMLVKGPVALVLFGLPVFLDACTNRRWNILSRHTWVVGPLLFLAICAPWYVLMARAKPGFLTYFFWHENCLRFLVHEYGDKYGAGRETFRGMALVWALVVTLPWSPFLLMQGFLRRASFKLRTSSSDGLLTWSVLSITLFWCLTSRVPLAYLLPVVPLCAALLAQSLSHPFTHFEHILLRLAPYAALIAIVATGATLIYTECFSSKMPGRAFQKLAHDYPTRTFCFEKPLKQPYSAEFYLAPRLHTTPQTNDLILVRVKRNGKRTWEVATP